MQIVNLTDKPITIVGGRGQKVKTYLPTGHATVDVHDRRENDVDGVPIIFKVYGKVHGLPLPTENLDIMYIVDPSVAKAVGDTRFDLLIPDGAHTLEGELLHRSLSYV